MSDSVWIVLIIAGAVVLVLFLFRKQLSSFLFKANKEGVEAELKTRKQEMDRSAKTGRGAGVTIRVNKQIGKGNVIDVGTPKTDVEDNLQLGNDQKIRSRSEPERKKKKS